MTLGNLFMMCELRSLQEYCACTVHTQKKLPGRAPKKVYIFTVDYSMAAALKRACISCQAQATGMNQATSAEY